MRACEKTGVSPVELENLVDEIEAELQQRAVKEVPSYEIGELILQRLQALNEVAYIRFASVYRQFRGIRDFVDTLNHLQNTTTSSSKPSINELILQEEARKPSTPSILQ